MLDMRVSYQYRKSHSGDKTIKRSFYLHHGISYTGKTASLYWKSPVKIIQYCHSWVRYWQVFLFFSPPRVQCMIYVIATLYVIFCYNWWLWYNETCRDQSRYLPSQWETSLQCNDVSHWLGTYLDWTWLGHGKNKAFFMNRLVLELENLFHFRQYYLIVPCEVQVKF